MWNESFNSRVSVLGIDRRLIQTTLVKIAFFDVISIFFS